MEYYLLLFMISQWSCLGRKAGFKCQFTMHLPLILSIWAWQLRSATDTQRVRATTCENSGDWNGGYVTPWGLCKALYYFHSCLFYYSCPNVSPLPSSTHTTPTHTINLHIIFHVHGSLIHVFGLNPSLSFHHYALPLSSGSWNRQTALRMSRNVHIFSYLVLIKTLSDCPCGN